MKSKEQIEKQRKYFIERGKKETDDRILANITSTVNILNWVLRDED